MEVFVDALKWLKGGAVPMNETANRCIWLFRGPKQWANVCVRSAIVEKYGAHVWVPRTGRKLGDRKDMRRNSSKKYFDISVGSKVLRQKS